MRYTSVLIIFFLFAASAYAQGPAESRYYTMMDQGADLMYEGKHEEADAMFLVVLKNLKSLPSQLAFYFGRNSFYLDKNKQAINWLNKYIELKGPRGQYFDEAIQLLEVANSKFVGQRESETEDVLAELTRENLIECPTGRMLCPVCNGTGVLIKRGTFDNVYQTCPYSGGDGVLTCEEYNKFIRGELAPIEN